MIKIKDQLRTEARSILKSFLEKYLETEIDCTVDKWMDFPITKSSKQTINDCIEDGIDISKILERMINE